MANEKKSLGQLLSDTFLLIKKNFTDLASVVAIVYVPFTLFLFVVMALPLVFKDRLEMLSPSEKTIPFLFFFILVAIFITFAFLSLLLFSIAILKKIKSCDEGQALLPLDSYKEARPLLGSFIIINLWILLKVVLWSLLLIIPGIIFAMFYSFAQMTFVFDGKKSVSALKASRDIIQPFLFEFFWKSVVAGILFSIVSASINFIIERVFPLKEGYHPIIVSTLENFIGGFLGVFLVAFWYFFYKDLKGRSSSLA